MSSTSSNTEEFTYNELMEQYVKATRLIEHLKSQRNRSKRAFDKAMDLVLKYDARIAELEAAQRWIPVSERLPEANVRVLFCNGNRFAVGWYDTNDDIYDWSCWDDKWPGVTPTHWMPIPQPPEDK